MKFYQSAFILLFLGVSCFANGMEKQCLVLSFSEFGNTRTCVQNLSLPGEAFREVCERPDDEYIKFKTTYVAACPPKYKGVCRGLKTQSGMALPYISFLYENDMDFMKSSCLSGGGEWESGDS